MTNPDDGTPDERAERLREAAAVDALERKPLPGPDDLLRLDPAYAAARVDCERVVRELAFGAPSGSPAPPASLKERLLARVSAAPTTVPEGGIEVKPGVVAVRPGLAEWTDAPLPGVRYKVLGHDASRGVTTRLVRFAPGTTYPNHRHAGTEELFVLEGSVHVNGLVLKAGDYCRSAQGTEEMGSFTDEGALAIIISFDADEISAGP